VPGIAVSMGDPGGIGPEVIVKALRDEKLRDRAGYRLLGLGSVLASACERTGVTPFWTRVPFADEVELPGGPGVVLIDYEPGFVKACDWPHAPNKGGGLISRRFVDDAVSMAGAPADHPAHADAIVTGPISKEAWRLANRGSFTAHTELLASRFRAERVGMLFDSPSLRVILATIHIPLNEIRNELTIGKVFDAIDLGHEACRRMGMERPKIAVCGLNPHAGEFGMLGDEETRLITPAIEVACENGIDASGPFPGDTIFNAAVAGKYDLVVAMYHDQGLIPVKLLHRDCAVNMTVGLPTVRTSPDHGTAFDIAGTGTAHAGSMRAAIELALRLTEREAAER